MKAVKRLGACLLGGAFGSCLWVSAVAADTPTRPRGETLEKVRQRGYVACGVTQGVTGFSYPDAKGRWLGFDADFCRAVAAAVLGDAEKVRFTPLAAKERFTALQSGEVDLLSRITSWTLSRDVSLGLDFATVTYYNGQGFMVPQKLGIKALKDLDGATICVNSGTTSELNLADYFRAHKLTYRLIAFEKVDEVNAAYDAGRCDAVTSDQAELYASRLKLKTPAAHTILPDMISKEPLGPLVRQGDHHWQEVVRWTHMAMLLAEEYQVNQSNVDEARSQSQDPNVQRLLGVKALETGSLLGLSPEWAYHAIKQVGNYADVYGRNLGEATPLQISRGLNRLWVDGGLLYPLPIR